MLGFVFYNNRLVNADLLRYGFAKLAVSAPNLKYYKELVSAHTQAHNVQKGIWARSSYYNTLINNNYMKYVGDFSEMIYHKPTCSIIKYGNIQKQIWFEGKASAESCRFNPCTKCIK